MQPDDTKELKSDKANVWLAGLITAVLIGLIFGILKNFEEFRVPFYASPLFILAPLLSGFIASAILSSFGPTTFARHVYAGFAACLFLAFGLMIIAFEGIICIGMASPLLLAASFVGSGIGYGIQTFIKNLRGSRLSAFVATLALPFIPVLDRHLAPEMERHTASTAVIINAPPEKIWTYLSDLPNLPNPNELLFKAGVAHPTSVRTVGSGVGAERHCTLSTGDMPEVVTRWEPNRVLEFKVLKTPPSMKETNPFGEVHAAHLTGYYECRLGRLELIPLAGGKTKLVGTSVYEHRFGPSWYWTLWTDEIVHEVHLRVLREIKKRAEASP